MFLIVPFKVGAAELEKSFETSFDTTSYHFMIVNTYDDTGKVNGYIVFDTSGKFYEKYDLEDRVLFSMENSTVDDLKVESVDDDLIVTRIDMTSGNSLWQSKFGGNGSESCSRIVYDYDVKGNVIGYLLIISTGSTDLDILPGKYIIKYDLNGEISWIKPLYTSNSEASAYAKNRDGDLLRISAYHGNQGLLYLEIFNKTKSSSLLSFSYDAMDSYADFILLDADVIFIAYEPEYITDSITKMYKYDYNGNRILQRELESSKTGFTN